MLRRITVFMIFSGLLSVSALSCGKNEPGNVQSSGKVDEKNFADIHKNVTFNKDEKEKMHGTAVSMEGGGHGSSLPGKKEKPDPNKVIATVNGEKILRKELDTILSRFEQQVDPSVIPSMEMQITDRLIAQGLLRQFVLEKKLTVADEVVDKEIAKMRDNIKNNPATKDKSLEQFLEFQGSNIGELKTAIGMSAALENYVSKNIDDKRLEEYFIKNVSNYNGETTTASHILVDTKNMKTQEEFDKAKAKIDSIKKELDGGADFAELAKKYSDCPTGKSGGDLGPFPRRGAMVDAFANVAFATEVGKISDPVKTEFGYHIIKVTDRTPAKDVSFSEVKGRVKEELVGMEMSNLIKELKEKAKIEVSL